MCERDCLKYLLGGLRHPNLSALLGACVHRLTPTASLGEGPLAQAARERLRVSRAAVRLVGRKHLKLGSVFAVRCCADQAAIYVRR